MQRKISQLTVIIFFSGCATLNQKEMVTGYINFPKSKAEIEINRKVEKEYINLSPMYNNEPKSKYFTKADEELITTSLNKCQCSMKEASIKFTDLGWEYFKRGNSEVASKRFNQAFLFDSSNYIIYWGFAAIMGRQNRNDESISLFRKAYSYNENKTDSAYAFMCIDFSNTLAGKYAEAKEHGYVDSVSKYLQEASFILPTFPKVFSHSANLYFDIGEYEKAIESYNKSVSLDSSLVNNKFQKQITDSLNRK